MTDLSVTSFTPNTTVQSAQVNSNFTNVKSAIDDNSKRAFPFGLIGTLVTGDEQGMKFIAPQALTVVSLRYKTGSGTATIRLQKDTTTIVDSVSVTSTVAETTSFNATAITAGQVITLDISAVSSGVDLFVIMECKQP